MRVIDYRQEHLADLMDGELSNGTQGHVFVKTYAESLELPGWSFTVLDHGHLIACVGISEMWKVWARLGLLDRPDCTKSRVSSSD